jgi:rare lipoprotein A
VILGKWLQLGAIVLMSGVFVACTHQRTQTSEPLQGQDSQNPNDSRYTHEKDFGPNQEIDLSQIADAIPRYEVRTIAGNKNPYTILGKTYHLIDDERSYKERGIASWYGMKFNGYHTSNGELYDMYAMTAAHKTLPIPSYVRVTHLENGKSVVVRINDRGPFHEGRIIDLSYAAAHRLGIHKIGTGPVEVEIVLPNEQSTQSLAGTGVLKNGALRNTESLLPSGTFLQLGAFGSKTTAESFAQNIGLKLGFSIVVASVRVPKEVHRVRMGPFKYAREIQEAREQLIKINIKEAHIVYEN